MKPAQRAPMPMRNMPLVFTCPPRLFLLCAAKKAMTIAADACIYTNHNFTVETVDVRACSLNLCESDAAGLLGRAPLVILRLLPAHSFPRRSRWRR